MTAQLSGASLTVVQLWFQSTLEVLWTFDTTRPSKKWRRLTLQDVALLWQNCDVIYMLTYDSNW